MNKLTKYWYLMLLDCLCTHSEDRVLVFVSKHDSQEEALKESEKIPSSYRRIIMEAYEVEF